VTEIVVVIFVARLPEDKPLLMLIALHQLSTSQSRQRVMP
jgi:hypothetical protein